MAMVPHPDTIEGERAMMQYLQITLQRVIQSYNRSGDKETAHMHINAIHQRLREIKLVSIVRSLDKPNLDPTVSMYGLSIR